MKGHQNNSKTQEPPPSPFLKFQNPSFKLCKKVWIWKEKEQA